ncbi:acyltransferase family protein [Helicobacter monodelphidis]|uniref:acyltransferase family protein n=1 Tax=Helicobacter sp. 15-1451 TaxID=2004995 RepID=UPI0015EB905C|nr:acyltransferase [Helicobacter sp. 15-1451]
MFGYFRFFLAFCVLLSHIQNNYWGINIGVVSVIIFYMLAGFVVSGLFHKIFIVKTHPFYDFFCDRILRIYPLYAFALVVCAIFVFISNYGMPHFSWKAFFGHIFIIPLNYYMFFDWSVLQSPKSELNHLTWSLGLELQAYLLLGLGIMFKRLLWLLFGLSLLVFIASVFGVLDSDIFGYRLIFGVFFIFVIGYFIECFLFRKTKEKWRYFWGVFFIFCLFVGFVFVQQKWHLVTLGVHSREVILGVILGILALFCLGKLNKKIKIPYNSFFGALSYGIFLTHTPSMWILDYLGVKQSTSFGYIFTLLICSILLALIGIFTIESPLQSYFRRK